MIMEKVVDFMDTEFAKDVLNPDEKIVFNKPCRGSKNNNVKNTNTNRNMKKQKKYEDFQFNLFGETIDVCFHDKVYSDYDTSCWVYGMCKLSEQVINLSLTTLSGKLLKPEQIKQTFVHECIHIMLESGQYFEESCNEGLVEWMAKCVNMMFFSNTELAKHF